MHSLLNWLSIIAALISAGLWFWSAVVPIRTNIGSGYGALVGVDEMTQDFKRQGKLNAAAAAFTGAAVLFQALPNLWLQ